jgi:hypothetical protein
MKNVLVAMMITGFVGMAICASAKVWLGAVRAAAPTHVLYAAEPQAQPFRLRGALIHFVAKGLPESDIGKVRYSLEFKLRQHDISEQLSTDDNLSNKVEQAVRELAAKKHVNLDGMSFHDVLAWIWANKEEIIKILIELLPLIIH